MDDFLRACFAWPALPATIVVLLCCMYWILVMLGAADLDVLDVDLDVEVDVHAGSLLSLGLVPLKFLNLGSVPLMVWMTCLGLCAWTVLIVLDQDPRPTETVPIVWALLRAGGIALVATKLLTNPLRGFFDAKEPDSARELMGRECVVTTSEVTANSGQAQMSTGAAPLLLNVRTQQTPLHKGDMATIVGYDPDSHLYYVQHVEREE